MSTYSPQDWSNLYGTSRSLSVPNTTTMTNSPTVPTLPTEPSFQYTPSPLGNYGTQTRSDLNNIEFLLNPMQNFYEQDASAAETAASRGQSGGPQQNTLRYKMRESEQIARMKLGNELLKPYLERNAAVNLANIANKQAMDVLRTQYGANVNLAMIAQAGRLNEIAQQHGYDVALETLKTSNTFKEQAQRYGFEQAIHKLDTDAAFARQVAADAAALERSRLEQASALERARLQEAGANTRSAASIASNESIQNSRNALDRELQQMRGEQNNPALSTDINRFLTSILGNMNPQTKSNSNSNNNPNPTPGLYDNTVPLNPALWQMQYQEQNPDTSWYDTEDDATGSYWDFLDE